MPGFSPWRCLGLLQNRNLPGMIELVLRDSVQHVIKVVPLAGNAITEARVGQSSDGFYECIVRASRLSYGLAPRRFCRRRTQAENSPDRWADISLRSVCASRAIPNRNVQHKLPNAVNLRKRLGGGSWQRRRLPAIRSAAGPCHALPSKARRSWSAMRRLPTLFLCFALIRFLPLLLRRSRFPPRSPHQ